MATAVQDTIYEGQRCPFDLASGSSLHQGQPATLMHLLCGLNQDDRKSVAVASGLSGAEDVKHRRRSKEAKEKIHRPPSAVSMPVPNFTRPPMEAPPMAAPFGEEASMPSMPGFSTRMEPEADIYGGGLSSAYPADSVNSLRGPKLGGQMMGNNFGPPGLVGNSMQGNQPWMGSEESKLLSYLQDFDSNLVCLRSCSRAVSHGTCSSACLLPGEASAAISFFFGGPAFTLATWPQRLSRSGSSIASTTKCSTGTVAAGRDAGIRGLGCRPLRWKRRRAVASSKCSDGHGAFNAMIELFRHGIEIAKHHLKGVYWVVPGKSRNADSQKEKKMKERLLEQFVCTSISGTAEDEDWADEAWKRQTHEQAASSLTMHFLKGPLVLSYNGQHTTLRFWDPSLCPLSAALHNRLIHFPTRPSTNDILGPSGKLIAVLCKHQKTDKLHRFLKRHRNTTVIFEDIKDASAERIVQPEAKKLCIHIFSFLVCPELSHIKSLVMLQGQDSGEDLQELHSSFAFPPHCASTKSL
eukprot:g19070.t1